MEERSESGSSEIQDNSEEEVIVRPAEEIDVWEPIKHRLNNSDSQSTGIQITSDVVHHEEVGVWTHISTERMRQTLANRFMRLLEAWVVIGLFVFVITGNVWLLTTAGLLGLPLQKILDYYFRRPKR